MSTTRTHGVRRVERWIVGTVMGVFALVIERVVLRSIRKGETSPGPADPTSVTASGSEVRAD
jgi:hypothetical protein